jgi:hypothetical protein
MDAAFDPGGVFSEIDADFSIFVDIGEELLPPAVFADIVREVNCQITIVVHLDSRRHCHRDFS